MVIQIRASLVVVARMRISRICRALPAPALLEAMPIDHPITGAVRTYLQKQCCTVPLFQPLPAKAKVFKAAKVHKAQCYTLGRPSVADHKQYSCSEILASSSAHPRQTSLFGRKGPVGQSTKCADSAQGAEKSEILPVRPGGYTPFEYVTFTQDHLTHEIVVKVSHIVVALTYILKL